MRCCASRIPNSLAASRLEATLPRGVPTPIRCRRRSPRLQPATCTSSRFRMFGCPRRWTHPAHPARLAHSGRTRRWVAGRWSRQTSSWRQRSCSRRVMLAASAPPWGTVRTTAGRGRWRAEVSGGADEHAALGRAEHVQVAAAEGSTRQADLRLGGLLVGGGMGAPLGVRMRVERG